MNRTLDEVKSDLKRLLVENLCLEDVSPEDITDDMNLFGEEGLGLDSGGDARGCNKFPNHE